MDKCSSINIPFGINLDIYISNQLTQKTCKIKPKKETLITIYYI